MKPYYEENGITIYNADCRDVLPLLSPAQLVCTDPPYNAGKDYGEWDDDLPVEEYQEIMRQIAFACLMLAPKQAWVAPRYQLPFWLDVLPKSHLVVIERGARGPYRGGWSDQF